MTTPEITITTDKTKLDREWITQRLQSTHWASKRTDEAIHKSIETSLCFGVFQGSTQVGFGRVISDYATTAYLCDMIVEPDLRGQGIGQQLVERILTHPDLIGLKWILRTRNAASLYQRFGFEEAEYPGRFMERITRE